jgi:hypothetical protein
VIGFFIPDAAVLGLAQNLLHIVLWSKCCLAWRRCFPRGHARERDGLAAAPDLDLCDRGDRAAVGGMIGVEGVWAAYPITFSAMCILQMG